VIPHKTGPFRRSFMAKFNNIPCVLLLLLSSVSAHAIIETPDVSKLAELLPASHLDRSGFNLPSNFSLANSSFSASESFPLLPMFQSKGNLKKLVGVQVPDFKSSKGIYVLSISLTLLLYYL
jgi:hypothetical protein